MKKILIMAAGCLIMFGTAQVYAVDDAGCKDQEADSAKSSSSGKSSDVSAVKGKAQTTCPVMGEEIDKALFVDVKGKRIYVCCGGCIKKVKADPAKYIKILEDQGVKIEKSPPSNSK